jgi:phospholipase/carboxylesterase
MAHLTNAVSTAGRPLGLASTAMIMLHGRGATAADILTIAQALERPQVAYLAPQADGNAWYPYGFMAPIEQNEPWLTSALATVDRLVETVVESGIGADRLALLGFSQGGCLALEYAARHPRRYGALIALSGGLIGPEGQSLDHPGSLEGTPVFLGCSDVDPHIPARRVLESAQALEAQDAKVGVKLYRGMGHEVNEDELERVRALIDSIPGGGTG